MKVEVTASKELTSLKLEELVGKKGTVVEPNQKKTGYFVKLDEPFQDYDEWFIPKDSLKDVKC